MNHKQKYTLQPDFAFMTFREKGIRICQKLRWSEYKYFQFKTKCPNYLPPKYLPVKVQEILALPSSLSYVALQKKCQRNSPDFKIDGLFTICIILGQKN